MVNKILGTTGTRILNAIFNLIILYLITNYIGSEGFGVIGLIIVAITIIQIFIDLLGGGSLVYFASRINQFALLVISYLWIAIVISGFTLIFFLLSTFLPHYYSDWIPFNQEINVLILAVLNAFMQTHYSLLIGKGMIKQYNIVFSIQISCLILSLVIFIFVSSDYSFNSYVNSLKISYLVGGILSFIVLIRNLKYIPVKGIKGFVKQIFEFGIISQVANGFHILNKRISFYFINSSKGLSSVGVYNSGIQLTEGLRLIGQSISLVQFSEIANSTDKKFAENITIKLMKLSVILTFIGVLVLLLIPESIYQLIFTSEFKHLKTIIFALSPGVVALAANTIFSHYFSGLGNPKISLWGNIIGFMVTLVLAVFLIPLWGFLGAALTASASYISTVIYQYYIFNKHTGIRFRQWLPCRSDIDDFKKIFRHLFKTNKS
jgi:O-antigen/teichoic acid export membrane protein